MRHHYFSIVLSTLFLITSCSKENFYDGDHFFVKNAGAEMPVYIKGNIESKVFILFVHGDQAGMHHWLLLFLYRKSWRKTMLLPIGTSGHRDCHRVIQTKDIYC